MRISDWRSDVCSSDLKGKNIVSSPQARAFYDALPDQAKFPDMTAIWHEQQRAIAEGKSDTMTFVRGLADSVGREVARVKEIGRASCRERVCRYVYIPVVAVSLNKDKTNKAKHR